MFFLGGKNMACDSEREYYIIKSKLNWEIFWMIHQETQRWYVFVHLGGKNKYCSDLQNTTKWDRAKLAMQPDLLAAGIWQARKMRLQKSTGNYFPLYVNKAPTIYFFLGMKGGRGEGTGCCWASVLRKQSRIPCLWLGIINVITACLEAPSFLGKDPGLADLSHQCGGWWKRDPAEASTGKPCALSLDFWVRDPGPSPSFFPAVDFLFDLREGPSLFCFLILLIKWHYYKNKYTWYKKYFFRQAINARD